MMTGPNRLRDNLVLVAAICALAVAVSNGLSQTNSIRVIDDSTISDHAGWRSKWEFRLTTIPADPVIPDSIVITIRNRSLDTLRGFTPFLTVYGLEGQASCWLGVRGEFVLDPGNGITIRSDFHSLRFRGSDNRKVDTTKLYAEMRANPWRMRVDFTDMFSPKPPTESNLNVSSNLVEGNTKTIH